ncbi:hypothetical protein [Flavivirga jejuensis]|uniref:Uncharacterized protein n=1 Tax=Flavivirga jejuensis TaxID=870487 RepID=A0ABT8WQF1_9FLAO|nr:hypothetical protein [Flavivirga jejuensis]MDO5975131.1 hypothetical protein [Flavivirga jejuensis]
MNLFWKDIEIGALTETNWDMRSSGSIRFKFNYEGETTGNTHLSNFIKHSIESSNYLENGDEENYNKMIKEESKFLDLINSSKWLVKSENDGIFKILCPIFHDNNEITWQRDYK